MSYGLPASIYHVIHFLVSQASKEGKSVLIPLVLQLAHQILTKLVVAVSFCDDDLKSISD